MFHHTAPFLLFEILRVALDSKFETVFLSTPPFHVPLLTYPTVHLLQEIVLVMVIWFVNLKDNFVWKSSWREANSSYSQKGFLVYDKKMSGPTLP